MPNSKPFPTKEADMNNYFLSASNYLVTNATRLQVSDANKTVLIAQIATWNTAYPASQNVNTRTKTAVEKKNVAKEKLMTTFRTIYADIPASVLTVDDRNALNLPAPNSSRTPKPVPTTKPKAAVDTSKRLEHTISFTNAEGGLAKPDGVRGCQIWFKIGDPAIDPSELSYVATDTASPYIYHFNGDVAGKNVYYWLRWENTRGETGPWSDVVMATVTG